MTRQGLEVPAGASSADSEKFMAVERTLSDDEIPRLAGFSAAHLTVRTQFAAPVVGRWLKRCAERGIT